MKVILLAEVSKVGHKFDIKEVSDGYAANFLFPRGLAETATKKRIQEIESRKESQQKKVEEGQAHVEELAKKLAGSTIELKVKASEQGHLFKGLRKEDIEKAVAEKIGFPVPENLLVFTEPLKEVGEHTVSIDTGATKNTFTLKVEAA